MATEAPVPINGNYGAPSHTSSQSATLTNGGSEQAAASPPKDEVGWYFVEQYYTTMSRSPEKVHLFYNKRSQFVYGVEAEKVPVSVGQRAISERISELGIEDCKVRVTNVDSQESGKSIVLQVVGEMSVKSQPHRKFAQTFVLAEQPNGYFVLNDIFRYIADEPEEDELEQAPEAELQADPEPAAEPETEIKTLTSSDNLAEQAKDVEVVDKMLEEASVTDEPAVAAPAAAEVPASAEEPASPAAAAATTAADEKSAEAELVKPEEPKDPEPSPVVAPAPAAQPPKEPAAPPKPAAPKTWASITAGGKVPVPVVPLPQSTQARAKPAPGATAAPAAAAAAAAAATPAATTPAATTAAAEPAATASAAPAAQNPTTDAGEVPPSPGGWQTAGQDNTKKQSRAQAPGNASGYIKNVTPNIDAASLRQALSQHGELSYFDVSRPKNCAFVEFKTPAGYAAAVAANPHKVNGEDIILEERRRANNYAGSNFRGGMRGNRNSIDGRTPSQGGRGGFKDNRGGFAPRGRGTAAGRGRGGAGQEA